MYERRNYLKKAFYHLMKIEMKKNKELGFDGYREANAELARIYASGSAFENTTIFVEEGQLCITGDFYKLSRMEQDALIQFYARMIANM